VELTVELHAAELPVVRVPAERRADLPLPEAAALLLAAAIAAVAMPAAASAAVAMPAAAVAATWVAAADMVAADTGKFFFGSSPRARLLRQPPAMGQTALARHEVRVSQPCTKERFKDGAPGNKARLLRQAGFFIAREPRGGY
jgi:hypothetical protein